MKSRLWIRAILALVIFVWIAGFQAPARGEGIRGGVTEDDQLERSLEGTDLFSSFQEDLTTPRFRMPFYFDPKFAGGLDAVLRPSVDLIRKESYVLNMTLPVSWDRGLYGAQDQGGTLSAGLFATLRFKVFPARYGSWSLNTGIFLIHREPSLAEETSSGDFEGLGRIGTINISISY